MTEFEKIKRFVLRNNSSAKLCIDRNGLFFIADQNGSLFTEHFILNTKNAIDAWKIAKMIIELNKNLNRTHPLKREFYNDVSARINRRRNRD